MRILHLMCSMLFGAVLLTACDKDNDDGIIICPPIDVDNSGVASLVAPAHISKADFEKAFVGRGWRCSATYEIEKKGTISSKDYYEEMIGVSPMNFIIYNDHITFFGFSDALPGMIYYERPYEYNELDNGIYINGKREYQICNYNSSSFSAIDYLAVRSNNGILTPVYAMSVFKAMSQKEIEKQLKDATKVE